MHFQIKNLSHVHCSVDDDNIIGGVVLFETSSHDGSHLTNLPTKHSLVSHAKKRAVWQICRG